ncbi:hypothetical protein ONS96_004018 [Cadophora gregata f. sp. sojae]|nr:hypothetical protein ONS96_004018 [Cadophora gregata f. sp. sojae]
MDLFLNGLSIDETTEVFIKLADLAFKPRARSVSVAPGFAGFFSPLMFSIINSVLSRFFLPKSIDGVGEFQDIGSLENDPSITAYSEVAAIFLLAEGPDFMVSLGTGAPRADNGKPSVSVSGPLRP